MFKKISEAYAILSNPQRKKKYDMWGETSADDGFDDMDGDVFTQMFGDLFGGSGGFSASTFEQDSDFEEFVHILEQDNIKSFKSMFRNLGKNYKVPKGKNGMRSRATKQSKRAAKFQDDEFEMMDEMMAMMMMGDLGGFGGPMPPGMGKKGAKK